MVQQWIKRSIDIFISVLAIVLLLPLWLLISIAIVLESRGPIFYRQTRPGKNEKPFTIYKFRSMRVNQIPPLELGAVKHNHSLVTKTGYLLRRFKLDETPQFINVLKGEMSLVGPRPCLPERIQSMSSLEKKRFNVLPGLAGWPEVNGNVELTFEEQLLLDCWYVENHSLFLDFKIIFKTFYVVVMGSRKNNIALENAKQFLR